MLPASRTHRFGFVGILALVALVAAPAAQDDPAQVKKMHELLSAVSTIDYAVIRGDLEDATAAAKALVEGLAMPGLPASAEKYLAEIKVATAAAAAATDLPAAAQAAGTLQAACGRCHAGLARPVKIAGADKAKDNAPSLRNRMREHAWSVEALASGLQGPSDDVWKAGANSMRKARLIKVQLKDPQLTTEVNEAEDRYRQLAQKAQQANDYVTRANAYGEILATCGHCHSLQGRVFGPAAPK